MKTPQEWREEIRSNPIGIPPIIDIIEAIQRDALSDPMANTTDQQELEIAKSIAYNSQIRADQLYEQMMKWREKYHEARRYLRAANKGAERNAVALELAQLRFKALNEHHFDTVKRLVEKSQ